MASRGSGLLLACMMVVHVKNLTYLTQAVGHAQGNDVGIRYQLANGSWPSSNPNPLLPSELDPSPWRGSLSARRSTLVRASGQSFSYWLPRGGALPRPPPEILPVVLGQLPPGNPFAGRPPPLPD